MSANDRFSRLIEEKTCNDKSVSDCTPINPTIVSILRDTMEEKYDFFLFWSFLCTCYISGKIIINFRQSCWKLLLYSGIWIGIFCFSLSLSFSRLARFFALSRKIRTRYFGGIYYSIKYKNSLLVKESESWKKKLVSEVAPNNIGRCSSLLHFFPSFPTFLPTETLPFPFATFSRTFSLSLSPALCQQCLSSCTVYTHLNEKSRFESRFLTTCFLTDLNLISV